MCCLLEYSVSSRIKSSSWVYTPSFEFKFFMTSYWILSSSSFCSAIVANLRRCLRLASISWFNYEMRTCVTTLTLVWGETLSGLVESILFGDLGVYIVPLGDRIVPSNDRDKDSVNLPDKSSPDLNDSPRISLSTGTIDSDEMWDVSILNGTSLVFGILTLNSFENTSLPYLFPPSIVVLFSAWPDNSRSYFIFS